MTYHRPDTLSDALDLLAGTGVRVLAGGTDIFPANTGRDLPGDMLDLTAIPALSGIHKTPEGWRIGATTRWSEIIAADLPPAFDALKAAARDVGSLQIQNSGTIAGNLCNASPAADGAPPLMVLEAEVELTSALEARRMPLTAFLTGVRKTALRKGEIVTAVHIPEHATTGVSGFAKLGARKYLVISIAMIAARLDLTEGRIIKAAIAVGSCSPVARRLPGFETALIGQDPGKPDDWQAALRAEIATGLDPIDDIRADAGYRDIAVAELITETIVKLAEV